MTFGRNSRVGGSMSPVTLMSCSATSLSDSLPDQALQKGSAREVERRDVLEGTRIAGPMPGERKVRLGQVAVVEVGDASGDQLVLEPREQIAEDQGTAAE